MARSAGGQAMFPDPIFYIYKFYIYLDAPSMAGGGPAATTAYQS